MSASRRHGRNLNKPAGTRALPPRKAWPEEEGPLDEGQRVAQKTDFCHAQRGRCSATCVCNQCRAVACHHTALGRVHHRGRRSRFSRRRRSSAALQEVPSSPDSVISARSQASFVSLSITLASDSRSVAGSPIFQLSGIGLLCCRAERTHWIRDVSHGFCQPVVVSGTCVSSCTCCRSSYSGCLAVDNGALQKSQKG